MPIALNLSSVHEEILQPTLRGLPSAAVGQRHADLGALGLSLLQEDLPLPVAILKESALAHNGRWMRDFTARAGVSLCPHGKTTMSPELFQRQFDDGAWGITAATASHVRTYRQFGVPRILLANQLVGAANIRLILDELRVSPDLDFYMLVDSVAGLSALRQALAERPLDRPLQVLLEVGANGGRTGVRNVMQGLTLGRAIRAAGPAIVLRGIEAFEGIQSGDDHLRQELCVQQMMATIAALAQAGIEEDWFAPGDVILTAGGSAFFDIAASTLKAVESKRNFHVILRSGCYLTHDVLQYERLQARMRQRSAELWGTGPGLRNAIEVWAYVQSVPEPNRAICGLGKRDISYDAALPQPIWWYRPGLHATPQPVGSDMRVSKLNDQHAYVDADHEVKWQVGDLVGFGIGHPCTTFDKWPLLYLVDDDYRIKGGVRTFF